MSGYVNTTGKPTLVVNPIACVAHGVCADLFPERIGLDEWGYPIIDPAPSPSTSSNTPAALLAHARPSPS